MGSIKWIRTYFAMLATPLRVVDVLMGHILFMALRVLSVCIIFLGVMGLFGAIASWTAIFVVPAGLLTGVAFAAPVAAFAATRDNDSGFAALFRYVIMPLFLFSGTFYPISQLPPVLRAVAYATPLWQGVDLCRTLDLGTAELWPSLFHVAYLVTMTLVGLALARRTFSRRLVL
jgi:lipooligosaccharide transport system permease protein